MQFTKFDLILLSMCSAGCRAPERKDPHDLRANPKVQLAQAKRFATGVLEHYNTNKVWCTIYSLDREAQEKSMLLSMLDWWFALAWPLLISCAQVKFELLDAKPVISIPEPRCCYTLHHKVQQGGFTGTAFLRWDLPLSQKVGSEWLHRHLLWAWSN